MLAAYVCAGRSGLCLTVGSPSFSHRSNVVIGFAELWASSARQKMPPQGSRGVNPGWPCTLSFLRFR
jgi:hypothetical protein